MENVIRAVWSDGGDSINVSSTTVDMLLILAAQGVVSPADVSSTLYMCLALHPHKKDTVLGMLRVLCQRGGIKPPPPATHVVVPSLPQQPLSPACPPPTAPKKNVFGSDPDTDADEPPPPPSPPQRAHGDEEEQPAPPAVPEAMGLPLLRCAVEATKKEEGECLLTFVQNVLVQFLQCASHCSNAEMRKEILDVLTSVVGGDLPGGAQEVFLSRWKPRNKTLLFKSILPRLMQQLPCSGIRIGMVIQNYLTGCCRCCCPKHDDDDEPTGGATHRITVAENSRRAIHLILAESQMHHQLFAFVVLRALLAFHHQPIPSDHERHVAPPAVHLFDAQLQRLLAETLQDLIVHTLGDGVEDMGGITTTIGGGAAAAATIAGRAALILYAHGFIPLKAAMALFFGNLLFSSKPAVDGAHAETANFEGCLDRAAKFCAELHQYVSGTHCETVVDLATSVLRIPSRGDPHAAAAASSSATPSNGEKSHPPFFRVLHRDPLPSWNTLLSKQEAKSIPWRTFMLAMLDQLLNLHLYHTAADFIHELDTVYKVDIFLYRGDGVSSTAADIISQRLEPLLADPQSHVVGLSALLPLLLVAQARIGASIRVLWSVCTFALAEWKRDDDMDGNAGGARSQRRNYADRVALVTHFVLPSLRAAPPSPAIYTVLHDMFERIPDSVQVEMRCADAVRSVARCPQDALRFIELEMAFNQNIRRMTLDKVHTYIPATIPVLFSNPMFVIEKLYQQSIGYENAQASIHAQLLVGAPPVILKLFLIHGIALMKVFAAEEREGAEGRVALVANFICAVWRVNTQSFDGTFALRQVEVALQRPARESLVFSNEFLKAVLLQLTSTVCEHEEQYNADQLGALSMYGSVAMWYGRGSSASYLGRWHPRWFNPSKLVDARESLSAALNQPVTRQPLTATGGETPCSSASTPPSPSVGHSIIAHLAKLNSNVYEILGDISGTMESVLLQCAKHHNTMNDVMFALAPMVRSIPTATELGKDTLPHITMRLASIAFRRASEVVPPIKEALWDHKTIPTEDLIRATKRFFSPVAESPAFEEEEEEKRAAEKEERFVQVQCTLSLLQPFHFDMSECAYTRAKKDADALLSHVEKELSNPANKAVRPSLVSSKDWIQRQLRTIEEERVAHAIVFQNAKDWVDAFLVDDVLSVIATDPVRFAQQCVVARAALSLEDTVAVSLMLRRLQHLLHTDRKRPQTATSAGRAASDDTLPPQDRLRGASSGPSSSAVMVNVVLTSITFLMTTFVSWTDGECKRLGALLQSMLQLVEGEVSEMRRRSVANGGGGGVAAADSVLARGTTTTDGTGASSSASDAPPSLLALSRSVTNACREATASSWTPAFILDCDAYLAQSFYQILSSPIRSSPNFCFRNAFILLDRIKSFFPRTPQTAAVMIAAVRNHSDKTSAYFAAATAQMKHYLTIMSSSASASGSSSTHTSAAAAGSSSYMRGLLGSLNEAIAKETNDAAATAQTLKDESKKDVSDDKKSGDDKDDDIDGRDNRRAVDNEEEEDVDGENDDKDDVVASSASSSLPDDDEQDDMNSTSSSSDDDDDDDGREGRSVGSNDGESSLAKRKRQRDDDAGEHHHGAAS